MAAAAAANATAVQVAAAATRLAKAVAVAVAGEADLLEAAAGWDSELRTVLISVGGGLCLLLIGWGARRLVRRFRRMIICLISLFLGHYVVLNLFAFLSQIPPSVAWSRWQAAALRQWRNGCSSAAASGVVHSGPWRRRTCTSTRC